LKKSTASSAERIPRLARHAAWRGASLYQAAAVRARVLRGAVIAVLIGFARSHAPFLRPIPAIVSVCRRLAA
jgi:hypothetical protein